VPRRNRAPRPRTRAAQVTPPEIQPTPPQLAQRLVARGLSDRLILGDEAYVPRPRADADQLSTAVDSSRSDEEGDR